MLRNFFARPTPVVIIIVAVMTLGILKFLDLPIALYPKTSKPKVYAWLSTGATSAREFQDTYGEDIEQAIQRGRKVKRVEGDYNSGSVRYLVEFDWGVTSDDAKQEVKNAVATFESRFPREWGTFGLWFDGSDSSQVILSLLSQKYSPEELAEIAETSIKPSIDRIEGVGESFLSRFDERSVLITVNPDALTSLGVDLTSLKGRIAAGETDKSLGELDLKEGGRYQVTAVLKDRNLDDLRNMVVAESGERTVRLRDVATVDFKEELPERFFKGNGKRSLIVGGSPKPDANIKQVAEDVVQIVTTKAREIDPAIDVKVLLNPAAFINEAVDNVVQSVIAGMIIATLTVFLFLGSLRSTLVICISMPLSLIGGFILMNMLGIEVNLISLGAMALAVGMVVDGAIVVLENIFRHMNEKQPRTLKDRIDVLMAAVAEVRGATIASLVTTIIVFAPLPFTSPITSAILGDLAIVMVSVLTVSIAVTLFVIPPLAVLFRCRDTARRTRGIYLLPHLFGTAYHLVERLYMATISRVTGSLKWALPIVVACLALLGAAGYLLSSKVEREIMSRPETDKLFLFMNIKGEEPTIAESEALVNTYETLMLDKFGNDLSHILSQVTPSRPWILAFLKDKTQIRRLKTEFEETFKNSPRMNFFVYDWTPTSLEIPNPPMLHMDVTGKTEEDRRKLLKAISETAEKDKRIGQIRTSPRTHQEDFLKLVVDPDRMALLSAGGFIAPQQRLQDLVAGYLGDRHIKDMDIDGDRLAVKIRFPEGMVKAPGDLENLLLRVDNQILPVKALAQVRHEREYGHYVTEDGRTLSSIRIWPKESFEGDKAALRAEVLAALVKSPDVDMGKVTVRDSDIEINDNINSLVTALVMALLLIAIVVSLQFGSIRRTGVIMLAIPLGFIGVAFSLWIFGSKVNVNSMLGMILLCGTAVNNSILMVDFYNRSRADGAGVSDAILAMARLRLRPILLTTLTTILGMLPIALAYGSGGEILQPLGIAVCGGLWISTLLTLVVVPMALKGMESLSAATATLLKRPDTGAAVVSAILGLALIAGAGSRDSMAAPLTLDQAESLALAENPEVKVSSSGVDSATAAERAAWAPLLPRVEIGRTYSQQMRRFNDNAPEGADGKFHQKSGINHLTVEEVIPNPLKFRGSLREARAGADLADARHGDLKSEVLKEVRIRFFAVLAAREKLQRATKSEELATKTAEIARKRYNGGYIPRADMERAEVSVRQAQSQVLERTYNLEAARMALGRVLGRTDYQNLEVEGRWPDSFRYFSSGIDAAGDLSGTATGIRIASLEVEAAEARKDMAAAGLYPDLSLGARFERFDPNPELSDPAGPFYFIGAKWELFGGGGDFYRKRAAVYNLQAASQNLQTARLDAEIQVRNILGELKSLAALYEAQKQDVNVLAGITADSQNRFSQGQVSSRQADDDLARQLNAEDRLVDIGERIISSLARLARETGIPGIFRDHL